MHAGKAFKTAKQALATFTKYFTEEIYNKYRDFSHLKRKDKLRNSIDNERSPPPPFVEVGNQTYKVSFKLSVSNIIKHGYYTTYINIFISVLYTSTFFYFSCHTPLFKNLPRPSSLDYHNLHLLIFMRNIILLQMK